MCVCVHSRWAPDRCPRLSPVMGAAACIHLQVCVRMPVGSSPGCRPGSGVAGSRRGLCAELCEEVQLSSGFHTVRWLQRFHGYVNASPAPSVLPFGLESPKYLLLSLHRKRLLTTRHRNALVFPSAVRGVTHACACTVYFPVTMLWGRKGRRQDRHLLQVTCSPAGCSELRGAPSASRSGAGTHPTSALKPFSSFPCWSHPCSQ